MLSPGTKHSHRTSLSTKAKLGHQRSRRWKFTCSHLAPRILSLFAPGVSMLLTSSSSLRHSMASSGRFVAAASVRLSASRCSYHSDTSDKCCEKVWDQTASVSFESDHVTQVVTSQHCSINSKHPSIAGSPLYELPVLVIRHLST